MTTATKQQQRKKKKHKPPGDASIIAAKKEGTSGNPLAADAPTAIRSEEHFQHLVDELLRRHGSNVRDWPDYADRIHDLDLEKGDVTEARFAKATDNLAEWAAGQAAKPPPVEPAGRLTWLPPVMEETEVSWWHVWRTKCGRYRIVRSTPKLAGDEPLFRAAYREIIPARTREEDGAIIAPARAVEVMMDKKFRTLEGALAATEAFHCEQHGRETVETNAAEIIARATKDGLDSLPRGGDNDATQTQKESEDVMKVKETTARGLLEALDMPASDWSLKKIKDRLNDPKKLQEAADGKSLSDKMQGQLRSVMKALQDGKHVVVLNGEAPAPAKAASANGKPGKSGKAKASRKKSDGGMSAIDAAARVLSESKKPLKAQEIVEKMQAKGYWTSPGGKTPHATIAAAMYVEINKKGKESRFKKAGRGEFVHV